MREEKEILFSGLIFWGIEFFPDDVILSLNEIRKWAIQKNLIWDMDAQFISEDRTKELLKHFTQKDELSILINLYKDESGNLSYLESPYVPIKTLIKKGQEVEIVYWEILPSALDAQGKIKEYGEIHMGFFYQDIEEEFSSTANAKLVVKKLYDLYHDLSEMKYDKKELDNGTLSIDVGGLVNAKFFKSGRFFDVELTEKIS